MSFENLLPQPPLYPEEARQYAEQALAQSREAAARLRSSWDQPYGADPRQRLDVHVAPGGVAGSPAPVLVLLHGGAWTNGYKEWMTFVAPSFTDLPAVVVAASYRLGPAHRFPAPLHDALSIIGWAQRNAERFGGDPRRVFVAGHSAGGHLVTLAALRRDLHATHGIRTDWIRHCLPVSSQLNVVFDAAPEGSGEARIREVFLPAQGDARQASPLHHLAGAETPILLAWGEQDWPRIVKANEEMRAAAAAAGLLSDALVLPGFDHFRMHLDMVRADNPWVRRVRALMREDAPG